MNYTKTIYVDDSVAKILQELLNKPGKNRKDTLMTYTANFENNIEADIKVCDTDSETTPYIDAVLFDNGSQVDVIEPSDELLGEYVFFYDDNCYTVLLEKKSEREKIQKKKNILLACGLISLLSWYFFLPATFRNFCDNKIFEGIICIMILVVSAAGIFVPLWIDRKYLKLPDK